MGKTLILAVRSLSACLLCAFITGQPATAQQPAAPVAPPAQQTATQAPAPTTPPPPVIMQPGQFNGSDSWSITLQEWLAVGHPVMGTGHVNDSGEPSTLDYAGHPRPIPGAVLTIPIGKQHHHALHASYFRVQGIGNSIAPANVILFGVNYYTGDYLAVHYTMQNARVGFDYLSWPFPVKDSKFHIKTLYDITYTTILTSVDAPYRHGTTDASGNLINTNGQGTDWFIYPSFGLGIDYLFSHKLRFEGRASGFIFPHRSTIYDAEASLNYRLGKFEVEGGLKTFHFKTSPGRNEYVLSTYPGVYVGLRWYPTYSSH
jgi:hypothetical protein